MFEEIEVDIEKLTEPCGCTCGSCEISDHKNCEYLTCWLDE